MPVTPTPHADSTPLLPLNLRCEYLRDPLGIDEARPRLSWALHGGARGERQSGYQVLVASTVERLLAGQGDLWDTGVVPDQMTDDAVATLAVEYDGSALGSGQRAWWTVRVWDAAGAPSPHPEPACWEMGLLAPDDWRAEWIGRHDPVPPHAPPPPGDRPGILRPWEELDLRPATYLRRGFDLPRPSANVRRARLYATARGVYELRLNGERVGDALLAPGWSDYRKRLRYQTYDVGPLLRDGPNTLGAILGTGWYAGHIGWGGETAFYGPHPRLLAQLVVEYDDGTVVTVGSDGEWRATTGPIVASDLLMGETYDARRDLPEWDRPGDLAVSGTGWDPVAVEPRDATPLVADRAEPIRTLMEIAPVTITPRDDGTTIVDLGQNLTGWVRLRARGPAGTAIRLRFTEVLNPDGSLYTVNLRSAHQTDTFILAGDGDGKGERRDDGKGDLAETFEPRFTFHGFRYVEVTGYPGELTADDLTGIVIGSDLPPGGEFACSDELVNQIQRAIVWGLRGNFVAIPTDCPQRDERLGWLADAQIFARTATANAGVAAFFTRWLEDIADAQSPEGAFPDVAPRLIDLADGAPAWGDGGVIIPSVMHAVYGDTRVARERLAGMTAWVDYLHRANPNLLWRHKRNNDFGDWLSVGADTSKELLATAYFAYSAALVARLAAVAGEPEIAVRYRALRGEIGAAFAAAYIGPDGRVIGPANTPGPDGAPASVETQTGYVLALHMDLVPADLRAAAAAHLVADIEARGVLTTGFTGVGYVLPVLTAMGYPDLAYRLLRSERFPSWGHMVRNGATTIWERWDGWTEERGFQDPNMNSFNHYSLGSLGEWLYRTVAGIDLDPARPGFAHVVVRPRPGGGLTWARATYPSVRGEIISAWERDGESLTLRVTIPPGSIATIAVPTDDPAAVTEGDIPASHSPGLAACPAEPGAAVFTAGAGSYVFRSPHRERLERG